MTDEINLKEDFIKALRSLIDDYIRLADAFADDKIGLYPWAFAGRLRLYALYAKDLATQAEKEYGTTP